MGPEVGPLFQELRGYIPALEPFLCGVLLQQICRKDRVVVCIHSQHLASSVPSNALTHRKTIGWFQSEASAGSNLGDCGEPLDAFNRYHPVDLKASNA